MYMYYDEKIGQIRYFLANRCFNDNKLKEFNKNKILANEIVTFDLNLTKIEEIDINDINLEELKGKQILAVIVRPFVKRKSILEKDNFTFCGYDLVELATDISAITNCGAMFESINYKNLNEYALISTYIEAKETQTRLIEEAPYESHAY